MASSTAPRKVSTASRSVSTVSLTLSTGSSSARFLPLPSGVAGALACASARPLAR